MYSCNVVMVETIYEGSDLSIWGIIKLKFKLLDFHPTFDAAPLRHACLWILYGSSPFVFVFSFADNVSKLTTASSSALRAWSSASRSATKSATSPVVPAG